LGKFEGEVDRHRDDVPARVACLPPLLARVAVRPGGTAIREGLGRVRSDDRSWARKTALDPQECARGDLMEPRVAAKLCSA
jgi:hypothetical protein